MLGESRKVRAPQGLEKNIPPCGCNSNGTTIGMYVKSSKIFFLFAGFQAVYHTTQRNSILDTQLE